MTHRLTTLDAAFLHAEDADPRTRLGIGGLAVLEGPIPDHRALMETLGERIAVCPRFAQRLRRRALDLSAPEWVDDDAFRLAHHVRRIAVPAPGGEHELFALAADVMSWRLDRSRPLWEIWVIDGLADGRWAMLMKVHPCIADAIATVHILSGLADHPASNGAASHAGHGPDSEVQRCPASATTASSPAEQAPRQLRAASPGADRPTWWTALRTSAQIAAGTVAATRHALHGSTELAAGLLRPVSSLNGPITTRRRYSATRVALDDVRQICRAFEVTVHDVALAALTESYREMLLRRGEQPGAESLRTLVPMSVAALDGPRCGADHATVLMPYLPVDEENPVLRLRMMHARLARMKARAVTDDQAGSLATAATRLLPFPVMAWGANLLSRLPQRNVATLAVNVPGPREPLQLMGREVVSVLPIPPIGIRLRTAAAVLSYADELFFGILADFDTVPDVDELARGVEAAVARLLVRSKRRRGTRDRRGLSLVVNS